MIWIIRRQFLCAEAADIRVQSFDPQNIKIQKLFDTSSSHWAFSVSDLHACFMCFRHQNMINNGLYARCSCEIERRLRSLLGKRNLPLEEQNMMQYPASPGKANAAVSVNGGVLGRRLGHRS